MLIGVIAAARRAKHDKRVALSAHISEIRVYAGKYADLIRQWSQDIAGTLRAKKVVVLEEGEGTHKVDEYPEVSVEVVP